MVCRCLSLRGPHEGPASSEWWWSQNTQSNANSAEELEYYFLLSSFLNQLLGLALSVSSVFLLETPGGFRDSLSCTPASGVIILNWMNTTDFVHIIKGYIPNRGFHSFTIFYNFSASLFYSFTISCRLSDGTVRKKPQNFCLFMLVGPAD